MKRGRVQHNGEQRGRMTVILFVSGAEEQSHRGNGGLGHDPRCLSVPVHVQPVHEGQTSLTNKLLAKY